MLLVNYFKASFARKKARRIFREYGYRVDKFLIDGNRTVEFANWLNPLVRPKEITQKEIDFFRKYIPEGSFAVDIGANIGDLTVSMALAAGASGLVIGMDPNPRVFNILRSNAQLNLSETNIVPLLGAAVEEEREFYFASSEASMSNGGLIEDIHSNYHGKFKLKEPVKGINLAAYLNDHYAVWLPKLSLIKIDTEGMDYFILKTLTVILEKYHPTIIAEVYHRVTNQTRDDLFSLLKRYGYTILNIGEFDSNINFTPKPINNREDMPKRGITENIIAFIPSAMKKK